MKLAGRFDRVDKVDKVDKVDRGLTLMPKIQTEDSGWSKWQENDMRLIL